MINKAYKKQPKVSIIVPVYNLEEYISGCIKSIIQQTYENIEIIIVDDGSKDRSRDICEQYQKKYPEKIVFIHQKNAGVSAARNVALDCITGDYVAFVDGDDCIVSNYVEIMLNLLYEHDADVASCRYLDAFSIQERDDFAKECIKNIKNIKLLSEREAIRALLKQSISPSSCERLYSRKAIGNIRFWEEKRLNEDKYFLFQVFYNSKRTLFVEEQMYVCLNRPGSTTRNRSIYNNDLIEVAEQICEDIKVKYQDYEMKEYAEYNYLLTLLYSAKLVVRREMPFRVKVTAYNDIKRKIKEIPKRTNDYLDATRRTELRILFCGYLVYSFFVRMYDCMRRKHMVIL